MKTNDLKKELTVENVINIIDNVYYDESKIIKSSSIPIIKFDIEFWNKVWNNLLDEFFYKKTFNKFKLHYKDQLITKGYSKYNNKYKDIWIENFKILSFNFLYPNIIIRLNKENKIKFNIEEYSIVYEFLVENYKNIKDNLNIKQEIKLKWKAIINALYGSSNYWKSNIRYSQFIDNNIEYTKLNKNNDNYKFKNLVSFYTEDIFNFIYYKYEDYIIKINTDQIVYLNNIPDSFFDDINKLNFKYDISELYDGKFKSLLRYIIQNKEGKTIKNKLDK